MNNVIHKYGPIEPDKTIEIWGDPVHIGIHADGKTYVWCFKSGVIKDPRESSLVRLVATGEEFGYYDRYFGTVIYPNGLVYHALEMIE